MKSPRSPIHTNFLKSDITGAYIKDNTYKMDFTRGHYERTIAQSHIV